MRRLTATAQPGRPVHACGLLARLVEFATGDRPALFMRRHVESGVIGEKPRTARLSGPFAAVLILAGALASGLLVWCALVRPPDGSPGLFLAWVLAALACHGFLLTAGIRAAARDGAAGRVLSACLSLALLAGVLLLTGVMDASRQERAVRSARRRLARALVRPVPLRTVTADTDGDIWEVMLQDAGGNKYRVILLERGWRFRLLEVRVPAPPSGSPGVDSTP